MAAAIAVETAREASSPGEFAAAWRALDQTDRIYVRRVVKTGQRFRDGEATLSALGGQWARFQMARAVQRFWWAWFLPAIVVCSATAFRIHPLVVGVVLAAAAKALVVRRNIRKAAKA